jgi:hypothetical protein
MMLHMNLRAAYSEVGHIFQYGRQDLSSCFMPSYGKILGS